MTKHSSTDRVRTDSEYDFINLHNSVNGNNGNDDELFDDSPFGDLNSTCEYFTPEQFCETIDPTDRHLSSFCINCWSIHGGLDGGVPNSVFIKKIVFIRDSVSEISP